MPRFRVYIRNATHLRMYVARIDLRIMLTLRYLNSCNIVVLLDHCGTYMGGVYLMERNGLEWK